MGDGLAGVDHGAAAHREDEVHLLTPDKLYAFIDLRVPGIGLDAAQAHAGQSCRLYGGLDAVDQAGAHGGAAAVHVHEVIRVRHEPFRDLAHLHIVRPGRHARTPGEHQNEQRAVFRAAQRRTRMPRQRRDVALLRLRDDLRSPLRRQVQHAVELVGNIAHPAAAASRADQKIGLSEIDSRLLHLRYIICRGSEPALQVRSHNIHHDSVVFDRFCRSFAAGIRTSASIRHGMQLRSLLVYIGSFEAGGASVIVAILL